MARFLILALLFVAALDADAAFRRYPAPAPAKKAAKKEPKPEPLPVVQVGDMLMLPHDVVLFSLSEDAKAHAGMADKSKEDAAVWADAKIEQGKAEMLPQGGKLVVKHIAQAYVPRMAPPIPSVGNGSGVEDINRAEREAHAAAVRNAELNAVLTVETLEGARGYVVRKMLLPNEKKEKKKKKKH